MKNGNKTQFAFLVAAALVSMTQANAETINITSKFTPVENLSAKERVEMQKAIEAENPLKNIDWENSVVGKNEHGQTEVREKSTLKLQAVHEPTCS